MKIVFFQGAFDLLNYGHVKAIQRIAKEGYLIIGLNTDGLIRQYKKRKSILPYKHRRIIIAALKGVNKVIPMRNFSPLNVLKKYNVDIYVLTREWEPTKSKEIAYMKLKGGKVIFTPRYRGVICSSDIRKILGLKEGE